MPRGWNSWSFCMNHKPVLLSIVKIRVLLFLLICVKCDRYPLIYPNGSDLNSYSPLALTLMEVFQNIENRESCCHGNKRGLWFGLFTGEGKPNKNVT